MYICKYCKINNLIPGLELISNINDYTKIYQFR